MRKNPYDDATPDVVQWLIILVVTLWVLANVVPSLAGMTYQSFARAADLLENQRE